VYFQHHLDDAIDDASNPGLWDRPHELPRPPEAQVGPEGRLVWPQRLRDRPQRTWWMRSRHGGPLRRVHVQYQLQGLHDGPGRCRVWVVRLVWVVDGRQCMQTWRTGDPYSFVSRSDAERVNSNQAASERRQGGCGGGGGGAGGGRGPGGGKGSKGGGGSSSGTWDVSGCALRAACSSASGHAACRREAQHAVGWRASADSSDERGWFCD